MKHLVFSRLTHLPKRGPGAALLAVLLAVVLGVGMFALAPALSAHAATNPRTAAAVPTARGSVTVIIGRRSSSLLIPDTASGCVGTLPWNNIRTCFGIVGSGRYVQFMWVQAYVRNTAVTALVQIYGPPGNLGNTPFIYLRPGETLTLTVSLYRNMPTGKYCGQTVALGPGSGTACESVIA
jgi:hypothetical protein